MKSKSDLLPFYKGCCTDTSARQKSSRHGDRTIPCTLATDGHYHCSSKAQDLPTLWSAVTMPEPAFSLSCFLQSSVIPSVPLSTLDAGAEGEDRTSSSNSITWYAGAAGRPMLVTLSDDWIRSNAEEDSSVGNGKPSQEYSISFPPISRGWV